MAVNISLKRSAVPGKIPTVNDLQLGELAINTNDGTIYFKKSVNNVETIVKVLTTGASGSGNNTVSSASYANYANFAGNASHAGVADSATLAISASYANNAGNAISSSYAENASTASYVLLAVSSSYATTSSYVASASYATNASLLNNTSSAVFATTGSNTFIGNQTVTGSLFTSGSNTLIGSTSLTGSLIVSGSETVNGYIQFNPVSTNIDQSISASYIYVSGSTQDLYFTQNGSGYSNTTRLRWLESNLYTGLLSGGVISASLGSTSFSITSGSAIIVNINASTASADPYPAIKPIKWNTQTVPLIYSGSAKITYVGVDGNGTIVQQIVPWGSTDITQWDTQVEIGVVLHLSGSVITGIYNAPQVSYGFAQRADDFLRAFGPLKISGHTLQASGSTLGLIKTSGTAYNNGANYIVNPSNPSTTSDPAINVSKIYRYYVSGSTPIIDTGVGAAGYTSIDPTLYNNDGTLTSVPGGKHTIQRVFWIPNSPTNAFLVYYGNATYNSALDANNAIQTEVFTEAPNTAQNGILLGYIIVGSNETNLQNATIVQGSLFRSINGIGNSNSTPVSTTLAGLSDVSVGTKTTGDLLYYNGATWNNSKSLTGNYGITGSLGVTAGITANLTGTASYATTASYALNTPNAVSSSYAATSSNVLGGTKNYIPLWNTNTSLSNSNIYQSGSNNIILINRTTQYAPGVIPESKLTVDGKILALEGIQIVGNQFPVPVISASRTDNSQYGTLTYNGWGDFSFNKSLLIGYTPQSFVYGTGYLYASNGIGINKTGSNAPLDVNGNAIITGSLSVTNLSNISQPNFVAYNTSTGQFTYASTSSFTAATASFVTASNVFGPFGRNSIISASYSISASNAQTSSNILGGTQNSIAKWTGDTSLGTSIIYDYGSYINIGGSLVNGIDSSATGDYSHAGGIESNASGPYSHAEGSGTNASGQGSHAEGLSTQAIGNYSHAEGDTSIASGQYSHAEGNYTVANGDFQHTQGKFNIASSIDAAFIIGNGSDDSNRSNLVFAAGNSFQITGSLGVTNGITGSLFGTASWSSKSTTSSYSISSSNAQTASYIVTAQTASYVLNAISASYILNAISASYSLSSSNASTASYAATSSNVLGGTTNFVTKWNSNTSLGSSLIYDNGTNIGIGTTSPGSLLSLEKANINDVSLFKIKAHSGLIPSTAFDIVYKNDAGVVTVSYYGGNNSKVVIDGGTSNAGGVISVYSGSGQETTRINGSFQSWINSGAGNVGIGTSTPAYKLDVSGSLNVTSASYIDNAIIGQVPTYGSGYAQFSHYSRGGAGEYSFLSDSGGYTYINAKSNASIYFRINNSSVATILNNGNFGIGKTSPSSTLDVLGNTIITGSLNVTGSILQNGGALAVQDGTILYSPTRAFTPTGNISTSGTTATSVGTQFTSDVVGMKLTISGESRIITAYVSTTQVTVNSAYSQNYSGVAASSWGVYYKTFETKTDGYPYFYLGNQSGGAPPGTVFLSNDGGSVSTQFAFTKQNQVYYGQQLGAWNNFFIRWSSGGSYDVFGNTTNDLGIRRASAGILEIFDGTTNGTLRDLSLRNITASGSATVTGSLNVNGTGYFTGDVIAYYSDERLKTNIRPIDNALYKVMSLGGYLYNPNDLAVEIGATQDKDEKVGVLAQEVQAVLPQAIKDAPFDKTGTYMTVQYEKLVPLLIEAIKEQQNQIDELKSIINGITK